MNCLNVTLFLMMIVIIGGSCEREARRSDEAERDHPAMKRARELENAGDREGAKAAYQSLLDRDATMARAHLALAFLLDKQGGNYVDAIYHYQRYLVLRPDTEKRRMIEKHIQAARLGYVGTVFTNEASILHKMAEIEKENDTLKTRLLNVDAQASQWRAIATLLRNKYESAADQADQTLNRVPLPVPPPRSAGRRVRVEKGDNLRKMAIRFFKDQERWRDIYELNRNHMKRPDDIHIGQMLLIPEQTQE
ncbi:MAG: LysM peptidoglycan-binding domain-containing protein [bacterium]